MQRTKPKPSVEEGMVALPYVKKRIKQNLKGIAFEVIK
jgi:hypothetical protein